MQRELMNKIMSGQNGLEMLEPPFPKNMLLEISNMCNHDCIFCAHSKSTRQLGRINKSFAEKILQDAYNAGTREVGFYCCGEPLIDVNLEHYISFAKKIGYEYTYITTNGALLDEGRMISLVSAGIDSIKFSINAANRDTYLLIHGKDDFDAVCENLKRLYTYRDTLKRKFKLFISCILTKFTIDEKKQFEDLFGEYCDEIEFFHCVNQGGVMPEIEKLLTIDGTKTDGAGLGNGKCYLPFNKLHVSYEGYLTICCTDFQNYLAVADLNKESIEDAWRNEQIKEIRRKFLTGEYGTLLCRNCLENKVCSTKPVLDELATSVDIIKWTKEEDIRSRVDHFINHL